MSLFSAVIDALVIMPNRERLSVTMVKVRFDQ